MDTSALFDLAVCPLRGDGTQRDLPAAVALLALCVERGNQNMMNVLAHPPIGNARHGEKRDTQMLCDAFVCGRHDICVVLGGNLLQTFFPHTDNNLTASDQRSMLGGAPLRVPRFCWQEWHHPVPMEAITTIARSPSTSSSVPLTIDVGKRPPRSGHLSRRSYFCNYVCVLVLLNVFFLFPFPSIYGFPCRNAVVFSCGQDFFPSQKPIYRY